MADLFMHAVLGGIVRLDRQESAGPDMKRHEVAFDAARVKRPHQFRREMQAGGGRRDSTLLARVNRLVVGAVALILGALRGDIGRQRHMAGGVDRLVQQRTGKIEGKQRLAGLSLLDHRGVERAEKAGFA
jgi:hypothetical protein